MRLFFAFMPPLEIVETLKRLRLRLGPIGGGRPVLPADFHVTLAFLGDVSEQRLDALMSIAAAHQAQEFQLVFNRCEHWTRSAAVVLTVGVVPVSLATFELRFRGALSLSLLDAYLPHVTLARNVTQAPVFAAIDEIRWTPRSFSLVRSNSSATESAYTVLGTWPLLYEE